jgi:hypothetical protein
MFDRIFQVIGERSVTPEGVVQYRAQDQLSGAFLTLSMGIEDADALAPGAFLYYDTVTGNNVVSPPGTLAKTVQRLGFNDVALRFGKVMNVYPIKGTTSSRVNVRYIGNKGELLEGTIEMAPAPDTDITKHPPIVDGRVVVLVFSDSDLTQPLATWPLDGDL